MEGQIILVLCKTLDDFSCLKKYLNRFSSWPKYNTHFTPYRLEILGIFGKHLAYIRIYLTNF